eukprot:6871546-Prymnesium_polylepis.1
MAWADVLQQDEPAKCVCTALPSLLVGSRCRYASGLRCATSQAQRTRGWRPRRRRPDGQRAQERGKMPRVRTDDRRGLIGVVQQGRRTGQEDHVLRLPPAQGRRPERREGAAARDGEEEAAEAVGWHTRETACRSASRALPVEPRPPPLAPLSLAASARWRSWSHRCCSTTRRASRRSTRPSRASSLRGRGTRRATCAGCSTNTRSGAAPCSRASRACAHSRAPRTVALASPTVATGAAARTSPRWPPSDTADAPLPPRTPRRRTHAAAPVPPHPCRCTRAATPVPPH